VKSRGRQRVGGEYRRREWIRRDRKNRCRTMDFHTRKGKKVKAVRMKIRK
jgi:hypothetical protein